MTKLQKALSILDVRIEMLELEFKIAVIEGEGWGYLKKIRDDLKEFRQTREELLRLARYK